MAKACDSLIDMIVEEIRLSPIVNMDETTVQVLHEPDRANTSKSYMWVARGGTPRKPVVVFRYHPTWPAVWPRKFSAISKVICKPTAIAATKGG